MSRGACLTVAAAMTLGAVGFVIVGRILGPNLPAGSWPFHALACLCGVVSLACLIPGSRPFTLRIIGTVIFLAYAVFACDKFGDREFWQALTGFVVWGLPAAYVAIWGNYPVWGKWAAAFRPEASPADHVPPIPEPRRDIL